MHEITVIITTYNLHKYIDSCFRELFAQTFQNFDILVADDCSKDDTREIIHGWKNKYPDRIKTFFLEKNLGCPALTRNAALDSGLIDGNYILFLDGDDSIEPDFLEKLYFALINSNAGVAICAYDRVESATGHVLCQEMRGFPKVVELPPVNDILAWINTSLWNKLWRRDVFGDGRFPAFKVGEEVALQFTRYLRCERIAFVDEVLIHYRVHQSSVISNTPAEAIMQFAEELKMCYQQLNGQYKDCMGLMVFLHIGISMAFRAADNKKIDLREHLKWTRRYLSDNFLWFKSNPYLKLTSLIHHGIKGVVLWISLYAYKINAFILVIAIYKFVSNKLHIDIKF